jgi:acyl-CoA synthetase (NDP forming)
VERREQRAESRSIARLVHPRSVAVIGASDTVGSVGRAVFRNLLTGGFDGPVYPVNPTVPHVASVPAFASVADIPDDVHLAVVTVPAADVASVVEQCATKRVRGVIVIATGFADAGPDGAAAERGLVELARGRGMRLIGPASMGLITTGETSTMLASFAQVPVKRGRIAVTLQSGPLGIGLLELARRLDVGISSFCSLGNKADVSTNDFLNFWDDDPDTSVVLLYTETFGNPRKFGRIARRVSRRKPIVAVKPGRGLAEDVAADALYQQAGVIRVDTVRQLFDLGRILVTQPLPNGQRVAVVANADSPAVLALDALRAARLQPAELQAETASEIAALASPDATVGKAIDLTHRAGPRLYREVLKRVLADPGVDAVLAIYAPPISSAVEDIGRAITEAAGGSATPVVAVTLGANDGPLVAGSPVPAFEFPEPAAFALGRIVRYAEWRHRPEGDVPELGGLDDAAARAVVGHALEIRPGGTLLPLSAAADLLASYGIPMAPARAVTSLEAALAAADAVGYPVALKAAGLEHLARSESGGVALDLPGPDELRGAYKRMTARLGVAMAEAVVQHMAPGGVETIVTVDSHPTFGPVVGFGLGGAFAEAIADRPVRSLPLTDADAAELVASSRAKEALDALGANRDAVEDLLVRLGQLVDVVPEVARLRLNPVLVSPEGAWVIAAAVHVARPAPPIDEVRRL